MTQITLSIPEIHCMSCDMLIQMSIKKIPGISSVDTDLKTKKVTIDFDEKQTSKDKIVSQIVEETWYKVA